MINLAREPYHSNMLELLRDSKSQETFLQWMVDEAGSSHSDVIAWRNLEKVYMKTHGFDPEIWELWYPEYFASDHQVGRDGEVWLCKRYPSTFGNHTIGMVKKFDSLKEAKEMALALNGSHSIMWARKKDGTHDTPSGNYFLADTAGNG